MVISRQSDVAGSGFWVGGRFHNPGGGEFLGPAVNIHTDNGYFNVNGNTNVGALSAGPHHYVFTYDGSNVTMYVDGGLDSTHAVTGNMDWLNTDDQNAHAVIGYRNSTTTFTDQLLNGNLYAVRLYNRALDLDDVGANFAAGPTAIPEPASLALLSLGVLALRRRA